MLFFRGFFLGRGGEHSRSFALGIGRRLEEAIHRAMYMAVSLEDFQVIALVHRLLVLVPTPLQRRLLDRGLSVLRICSGRDLTAISSIYSGGLGDQTVV